VEELLESHTTRLTTDVSREFGLDLSGLTALTSLCLERFLSLPAPTPMPVDKMEATKCSWFTKRGEPCNKDRKQCSLYCSVHTDSVAVHEEEIEKARRDPKRVDVTRKGLVKTGGTTTSQW
jgi:hypothetical protein